MLIFITVSMAWLLLPLVVQVYTQVYTLADLASLAETH